MGSKKAFRTIDKLSFLRLGALVVPLEKTLLGCFAGIILLSFVPNPLFVFFIVWISGYQNVTGNIYEDLNIRICGEHPVTASLAPMGRGGSRGGFSLCIYF